MHPRRRQQRQRRRRARPCATPAAAASPDASAGQRGLNRQPLGIRVGSGVSPLQDNGFQPLDLGHDGQQRPRVGCCGSSSTSSVGPISTTRPRYITASRSAMFQASPRSWVTTRMVRPSSSRSLQQQGQDLAPHRGVQRRHRLVGDDHRRVQDEGAGDDDALALAAGQLVRVAQEVPLRRPQPGPRQRLGDLLPLVARHLVHPQALGHRLVDGVPRVQRAGRVLQDQLDLAAVGLERAGGVAQRLAAEAHLAAGRPLQAEDRAGQRRLAATGLTGQRDDLARRDGQVDPVDRAGLATTAGAEGDLQVADLDDRRRRRTLRGRRATGRSSPSAAPSSGASDPGPRRS